MEEAMANLNLTDFEFFKIMLPGLPTKKLRLPDKFARELEDRELRDAKLQVAGGGRRLWDVKVVVDGDGDVYLGRGWQQFARAHDLQVGHFLVFRYYGTAVFTVTVFDESMCRRHYQHEDAAGSGSSSDGTAAMDIEAPSQFTVTMRQFNLCEQQDQYLNVPVEFQEQGGAADGRAGAATARRSGTGGTSSARTTASASATHASSGCSARATPAAAARNTYVLKVAVRRWDGTFLE